jgi:hypothetical protein
VEGDEALEGAEGDGDYFCIFGGGAKEDGSKEVVGLRTIC